MNLNGGGIRNYIGETTFRCVKNKVRKLRDSKRKRKIRELWGGNLVGATDIERRKLKNLRMKLSGIKGKKDM